MPWAVLKFQAALFHTDHRPGLRDITIVGPRPDPLKDGPAAFAAMAGAVRDGTPPVPATCTTYCFPLVNALFAEPSPSVINAVLAERGLIADATVRSPLRPPATASVTAPLDRLRTLGA